MGISSNITDEYGNSFPSSYNSKEISPFQSEANISNYNGRIRTWRESKIVLADSKRIYLGGTKGIDVLHKGTGYPPTKWAYALNGYKIGAMCLANYSSDLTFSETAAPYLKDLWPASGGSVRLDDSVFFTVADLGTAVNITDVTVYINGAVAFAGGYGGWSNSYVGSIEVSHQELDFTIEPSGGFSEGTVSVRIIAYDLLGNQLDTTYSFTASAISLGTGFGGGSFGTSPFGGI